MKTEIISEVAQATLDGTISFPDVVSKLIEAGVEYYHVDFVSFQKTFYSGIGGVIKTPIKYEGLPAVSENLNIYELQKTISEIQQGKLTYKEFASLAMNAGVQSYFAFLRGQRVTYISRTGDFHVEWFPGAEPAEV